MNGKQVFAAAAGLVLVSGLALGQPQGNRPGGEQLGPRGQRLQDGSGPNGQGRGMRQAPFGGVQAQPGLGGQVRDRVREHAIEMFDLDGDGVLNEGERAEAQAHVRARAEKARAKLLEKFDTDGDGMLGQEERQAAREQFRAQAKEFRDQMVSKFDADADGKLDPEERRAAHESMRAEMQAWHEGLISKYDADGDGRLSIEERDAADEAGAFDDRPVPGAMNAARRFFERRRGGPGGPGAFGPGQGRFGPQGQFGPRDPSFGPGQGQRFGPGFGPGGGPGFGPGGELPPGQGQRGPRRPE